LIRFFAGTVMRVLAGLALLLLLITSQCVWRSRQLVDRPEVISGLVGSPISRQQINGYALDAH
ncbi:hypothetical protein, partial [Mesorhizobium sp. YM1C-6-2]|uniref:hypothetical protein n=1 Tax=Mesorhizobium sp. YM1C-6-2 TaxID=1827501 RepID=UPI000F1D1CE4